MLYLNVSKSSAGRYSEYIRVHLCYIAMSLNRLPAGILSLGFTNPKSLDRVLEFLIYINVDVSG